MNTFDKFDQKYCTKVCNAVWDAIESASREPLSGLSPVRNREAYSALINVMAMMLAQSKAPAQTIDQIAAHLAETLVKRVGLARAALRDTVVVSRKDTH
jgi:hypothetical protein